MVIIDRVINTLLGGLTLDPAGMHCPSWDDAFVSSLFYFILFYFITGRIAAKRRPEYHFACSRKVVHLCFITSLGKMIQNNLYSL